MSVWVFSQGRYGAPILEAVLAWSRRSAVPVVVVRSRRRSVHGLERIKDLLRRSRDAHRLGARVLWADVNDARFQASIPAGTHGLIAGFNQILKRPTIERFATLVNVHPSVLPLYRGPAPSHWALARGETRSGFTLHRVTPRVDAGEVLYQDVVGAGPGDSPSQLDERIARRAAPIATEWLAHVTGGAPWLSRTVDASDVYAHPVDYLGFPERT